MKDRKIFLLMFIERYLYDVNSIAHENASNDTAFSCHGRRWSG
jgi:hypothetical protein